MDIEFQSTLPVRGATSMVSRTTSRQAISIHAPREGSDHCGFFKFRYHSNFNPRSP